MTPISIQEACRRVGVSRRTMYNWMETGKVKFLRTAGQGVRIIEETLWRDGNIPAPKESEHDGSTVASPGPAGNQGDLSGSVSGD